MEKFVGAAHNGREGKELKDLPQGKPPTKPKEPYQDMSSHISEQNHVKGAIEGLQERVDTPLPVIHFVVTRFMQDQGQLVHLAKARLKQFKAICLPSIGAQTSKQFFWVIRVDPNLDVSAREEMVTLLEPYPNFYLVPSNMHYFPSSWRKWKRAISEILESPIFSGDQKLLQKAWERQKNQLLLETRLDADDGLSLDFIEEVQHHALSSLHKETIRNDDWKYFCTNSSLDWQSDESADVGLLRDHSLSGICFASGLTVASSGIQPEGGEHRNLVTEKGICEAIHSTKCVDIMYSPTKHYLLRTRSVTSTSMALPQLMKDAIEKAKLELNMQSSYLKSTFGIERKDLKNLNIYLYKNLVDIAFDNIEGRCQPGHSCLVRW